MLATLWAMRLVYLKVPECFAEHSVDTEQKRISAMALIAILSGLLITSAVSAALMWLVRYQLGVADAVPYLMILNTDRYISYAGLAPIALLCTLLALRSCRVSGLGLPANALSLAIIATAALTSYKALKVYSHDDELGVAAAAISAGVSPVEKDADNVWPGAREDWFWVNALPKTVDYIKNRNKAVWKQLPRIGDIGGQSYRRVKLNNVTFEVRTFGPTEAMTAITADITNWDGGLPSQTIVRPLTNEKGTVVGYACILRHQNVAARRQVIGFCPGNSIDAGDLFIGPLESFPRTSTAVDADDVDMAVLELTPYNLTDKSCMNGVWAPSNAATLATYGAGLPPAR
jgi:hypothetical protein